MIAAETSEDGPPPLSPSVLAEDGLSGGVVSRTFIHFPHPDPAASVASGSNVRAQSVPKDLGSGTDSWQAECFALGRPPLLTTAGRVDMNSDRAPAPPPRATDACSQAADTTCPQHPDAPHDAYEWSVRCLALGLQPWPSDACQTQGDYGLPQWCGAVGWNTNGEDLSSLSGSTCADSAEWDFQAAAYQQQNLLQWPHTIGTIDLGAHPSALACGEADFTPSQMRLQRLRASGAELQATMRMAPAPAAAHARRGRSRRR